MIGNNLCFKIIWAIEKSYDIFKTLANRPLKLDTMELWNNLFNSWTITMYDGGLKKGKYYMV